MREFTGNFSIVVEGQISFSICLLLSYITQRNRSNKSVKTSQTDGSRRPRTRLNSSPLRRADSSNTTTSTSTNSTSNYASFRTRTSGRTYWWQRLWQCPDKCCTRTWPGPVHPPRRRRCLPARRGRCCSPQPGILLCWPVRRHSRTGDPRPPSNLFTEDVRK